jgi:anti-sigma B factor antagonist
MMTQPTKLQIAEHQHSDIAVVTLSGEMTVDDGDLAFGRYIDQMVAAGRCKIIVDLSNVTYLDSAAVGMLVAKQKTVQRQGGAMRLAQLTARSHHLFAMLKLKFVFEIYEDVDAAIRSFAWRPR